MSSTSRVACFFFFFFFNDTATTEIYTLSLHDALPISLDRHGPGVDPHRRRPRKLVRGDGGDRKSTRLNSSHQIISYAVFCLKKKKNRNAVKRQMHDRRTRMRATRVPSYTIS